MQFSAMKTTRTRTITWGLGYTNNSKEEKSRIYTLCKGEMSRIGSYIACLIGGIPSNVESECFSTIEWMRRIIHEAPYNLNSSLIRVTCGIVTHHPTNLEI
eukprot:534858_1